jgi:hypothetical protein
MDGDDVPAHILLLRSFRSFDVLECGVHVDVLTVWFTLWLVAF